jgi:hypothetical protein
MLGEKPADFQLGRMIDPQICAGCSGTEKHLKFCECINSTNSRTEYGINNTQATTMTPFIVVH